MGNYIKSNCEGNEHKVTVIIPAYNSADTIGNALEMVRKQTLKELEVIVVDDGSTDETRSVVESYMNAHNDMDITYLYQENAGPGAARNQGLNRAKGEYIAFFDSDDAVPIGAYNAMYYSAKQWDADVIVGLYLRREGKGRWYIHDYIKGVCEHNEGQNCAGNYSIAIHNPSLWNRLYKKEFLNRHGIRFLPEYHGEDVAFNVETVRFAERVYTLDEIVYHYTKETEKKNTLSTNWSYKNTSSYFRIISSVIMQLHETGADFAEVDVLRTHLRYLLDGISSIDDKDVQAALFDELKAVLKRYQGVKKYQPFFTGILRVDLDVFLEVSYDLYQYYCRSFATPQLQKTTNNYAARKPERYPTDYKDLVLEQFKTGDVGFKYVIQYAKAWLRYKLKHR